MANQVVLQGVADYLGVGVDMATQWSSTSIVLAQIKQRLEALQKDVDTLLHCELESANKRFKDVSVFLKRGKNKDAFKEMEKVLDLAIVAFTKVKKFEDKVKCKWLSIFCRMMILSYETEQEKFLPLNKVSCENKEMIAELVFNDLGELIEKFDSKKVSWSKWLTGNGKKKERDALDGLLRATLPMIWHHVQLFSSPETWPWEIWPWDSHNGEKAEALKYIPRGESPMDGAVIPFGDVGSISIFADISEESQLVCKFGKS